MARLLLFCAQGHKNELKARTLLRKASSKNSVEYVDATPPMWPTNLREEESLSFLTARRKIRRKETYNRRVAYIGKRYRALDTVYMPLELPMLDPFGQYRNGHMRRRHKCARCERFTRRTVRVKAMGRIVICSKCNRPSAEELMLLTMHGVRTIPELQERTKKVPL